MTTGDGQVRQEDQDVGSKELSIQNEAPLAKARREPKSSKATSSYSGIYFSSTTVEVFGKLDRKETQTTTIETGARPTNVFI